VPTLVVHVALVVPRVRGKPIAEVAWVQPMIVAFIAFIVANIVGNVVAAQAPVHRTGAHHIGIVEEVTVSSAALVHPPVLAALYGLLPRVRDRGMPLVSVTRDETDPPTTLGTGQADVADSTSQTGVGGLSTSTTQGS
jgi:hypothetical protein